MQKLSADLFEYKFKRYLLIADYFSRYIIVKYLPDLCTDTVSNTFMEVLTDYCLHQPS